MNNWTSHLIRILLQIFQRIPVRQALEHAWVVQTDLQGSKQWRLVEYPFLVHH